MSYDRSIDKCQRRDLHTFVTVEYACVLADMGTEDARQKAARFMCRNAVPLRVALRVITTPHLRRRAA